MIQLENPTQKKEFAAYSVVWGGFLILLGLMSLITPWVAGVLVSVVIGWVVLISGFVHFAHAFQAKRSHDTTWKFLVSLLYIVIGILLIFKPMGLVTATTLLLGLFFLAEGAVETVIYFGARDLPQGKWHLLKGIITLLLGVMILIGWPSSAIWVIGTFVGISLIFSGWSRVVASLPDLKSNPRLEA